MMMTYVRPKKHLGQHFLKDLNIAEKIATALTGHGAYQEVLEIGPGTGVLTQYLMQGSHQVHLIDVDQESVNYLKEHFDQLGERIMHGDFLKKDLSELLASPFAIIGNFPYNISSQIFFKILDYRDKVPEVVCMIQKEVADRLVSPPGNKTYGILSVLLQAYYNMEYLFTVPPHVFNPPPKVNSAVIRLQRNEIKQLDCDEKLFRIIVKQGFQNRRKTLRNALKTINLPEQIRKESILSARAEQLSVEQFVELTHLISSCPK